MNLSKKQKHTHRPREKTCGCQRGLWGGEGLDWDFEISKCKLLYIEWMNNKALLYNTGNCIQHSLINHNEK